MAVSFIQFDPNGDMHTHSCDNPEKDKVFIRLALKQQGLTFNDKTCTIKTVKKVGTRAWHVYSEVTSNTEKSTRFSDLCGIIFVCAVNTLSATIIKFNSEEELLAQYTKDSVEHAINEHDLHIRESITMADIYSNFAPDDDYDGLVYLSDGVWMTKEGELVDN